MAPALGVVEPNYRLKACATIGRPKSSTACNLFVPDHASQTNCLRYAVGISSFAVKKLPKLSWPFGFGAPISTDSHRPRDHRIELKYGNSVIYRLCSGSGVLRRTCGFLPIEIPSNGQVQLAGSRECASTSTFGASWENDRSVPVEPGNCFLFMMGFFERFFSADGFMPHGMCYEWNPVVIWLHVISDGFITAAYYSIPITLFYFVHKRKDPSLVGFFSVLPCSSSRAAPLI